MIVVDTKEFHGDRKFLAEFLHEKLRVETHVERNRIELPDSDQHGAATSLQNVKDVVKRALHHMGLEQYRVVTEKGGLSIREERVRERRMTRRGSAPSAQQSLPYFFPG